MYMRSGKAELQNVKEDNAMWTEGTMDGYEYWVKHYEVGSSYGIDEGRISKLSIRKNGVELYGYDRGCAGRQGCAAHPTIQYHRPAPQQHALRTGDANDCYL